MLKDSEIQELMKKKLDNLNIMIKKRKGMHKIYKKKIVKTKVDNSTSIIGNNLDTNTKD